MYTKGAVNDSDISTVLLRKLRWALFKCAYDAGSLDDATEFLELSRPPEDAEHPPKDAEPSTPQERLNWGGSHAMMLSAQAKLDKARVAYIRLARDYLGLNPPDETRFAILSNAIQAAYELGEYEEGRRLLDRAEELAKSWPR